MLRTGQFLLRQFVFRLVGVDQGGGLFDHRLLALQGGAGMVQLRLGAGYFGAGRGGGGLVVAVVDARQQSPALTSLVVFHQHFPHDTGHLGNQLRCSRRQQRASTTPCNPKGNPFIVQRYN